MELREAQPVHISVSDEAYCSGPDARRLKQDLEVLSLPQKADTSDDIASTLNSCLMVRPQGRHDWQIWGYKDSLKDTASET